MERKKVFLTPELAEQFMEKNFSGNRQIRETIVLKYEDDIKNGAWNQSDDLIQIDPIMFSKDGEMINGQHRCKAVINTKIGIWVYVATGADPSIYNYLDGGEKRRTTDFLVGVTDKRNFLALAMAACAIDDGTASLRSSVSGIMLIDKRASQRASRTRVLEKAKENQELYDWLISLGSKVSNKTKIPRSHAAIALYILMFVGKGDYIERFVDDLCRNVSESTTNTLFKEFALRVKADGKRFDKPTNISCVLYAYDHFLPGTEVKSFNRYTMSFPAYDKLVEQKRRANQ